MGAVSADGEDELEQELVGFRPLTKSRMAILTANEGELAGGIGQEQGRALVVHRGVDRPFGGIEAGSRRPAPPELILEIAIGAERRRSGKLRTSAPGHFGPGQEVGVDRSPQGPVTQRGVRPEEAGGLARPRVIVPPCEGGAEVEVGRLGQVPVSAQVGDVREIGALLSLEDRRFAAVDLADCFDKRQVVREKTRHRDSRVSQALLPRRAGSVSSGGVR